MIGSKLVYLVLCVCNRIVHVYGRLCASYSGVESGISLLLGGLDLKHEASSLLYPPGHEYKT